MHSAWVVCEPAPLSLSLSLSRGSSARPSRPTAACRIAVWRIDMRASRPAPRHTQTHAHTPTNTNPVANTGHAATADPEQDCGSKGCVESRHRVAPALKPAEARPPSPAPPWEGGERAASVRSITTRGRSFHGEIARMSPARRLGIRLRKKRQPCPRALGPFASPPGAASHPHGLQRLSGTLPTPWSRARAPGGGPGP